MAEPDQVELPEGISWVPSSDCGEEEGIVAGHSGDGEKIRIARAIHGKECGTATLIEGAEEALAPYFGTAVPVADYEILVSAEAKVHWVSAVDGEVPDGAIPVGLDTRGKVMFVARVVVDDITLPAKLLPIFKGAFAAWKLLEYMRRKYEVLCILPEGEEIEEECEEGEVPGGEQELTDTHEECALNDPRADEFEMPEGLVWKCAWDGDSFDDAIICGPDAEDRELHVVRGSEERELASGVLRIGEAVASIPYYGFGSKHDKYEVLVNEGCIPLKWVKASCGEVPDGAVRAGTDVEGTPIWVARAWVCGVMVPGKLVTWTKRAYAAQDGIEYTRKKYQVLCVAEEGEEVEEEEVEEEEESGDDDRTGEVPEVEGLEWVQCRDGEVPESAVAIEDGCEDVLYVARASEETELCTGYVKAGAAALMPYQGIAESNEVYDVLVNTGGIELEWTEASATDDVPEGAVQGGVATCGDRIFVARVQAEGGIYYGGKWREGHETGYFAYDCKEVAESCFEVLRVADC